MRHHIRCRFCSEGSYESLKSSNSADLHNLQLGLGWQGDDEDHLWTVMECSTCGNIQVFRGHRSYWEDKI